jgi:hypothetical protein
MTFYNAMKHPLIPLLLLGFCAPVAGQGIELSGLLDVRAQGVDATRSWTDSGLGKLRYDTSDSGLRLGQGIVAAEMALSDAISGTAVLNASAGRRGLVDLQEAWLGWNPVPTGAWKLRAKAGLFFPPMNQEIDYDRPTWTPTRTISASAINSWLGEEFRTKGLELGLTHLGRASGSPHTVGASVSVFGGNDAAGTLMAWRGWGIGDRISGLSESIELADLPVYRPDGEINRQTRAIHPFREIDGRLGYYAKLDYAYADTVALAYMHYDNRGDPMVVKQGQYSWTTRFDHASLRVRTGGDWEFLFQWMNGSTMMGPRAAYADFHSWYALASRRLGQGRMTLRYDHFGTHENDKVPSDPNGEAGHAVALAYVHELTASVSLVTELLVCHSTRPARMLIGDAIGQRERSLTTALRWQF